MQVTLKGLRRAGACYSGYNRLVRALQAREFTDRDEHRLTYIIYRYDKPIDIAKILASNGIFDAVWALRCVEDNKRNRMLLNDLSLFLICDTLDYPVYLINAVKQYKRIGNKSVLKTVLPDNRFPASPDFMDSAYNCSEWIFNSFSFNKLTLLELVLRDTCKGISPLERLS